MQLEMWPEFWAFLTITLNLLLLSTYPKKQTLESIITHIFQDKHLYLKIEKKKGGADY